MYTDRYKQEEAMPLSPEPTASTMRLKLLITIGVMALISLPAHYAILFWMLSALSAPTWVWVAYGLSLVVGISVTLYTKWLFAEAEEQAGINAVKKFQQDWYIRYGNT